MNGSIGRFVRRATLASLVAATALGAAGMAPANAVTIYRSGDPGTATVPAVILESGYGIYDVVSGARTVYESPRYAAYDQYVCVTHRLWQYVPIDITYARVTPAHWSSLRESNKCGWIPAARTSIQDLGVRFTVDQTGDYGVDVVVTWQGSPTAPVFGSRTYDYASVNDYMCRYGPCTANDDNNGLGAYAGW